MPRKQLSVAELEAFGKRHLVALALIFLAFFMGRSTCQGQREVLSDKMGPLKTLCYLSRDLERHPDFFSALYLDPFSSELEIFRYGKGNNDMANNLIIKASVRALMRENVASLPDIFTATEALMDEDRLRAYLGWVIDHGAQRWEVIWERQCAGI
ncbi:unnamed protein product [Clonostachys rosea]|uniref:Uncharacterized protein n=1 Tax=Bionectria ochroleuca TaxID=29856 RepID=A0ABY6UDT2_BIOOC|nr:unnamed protein product [Clonostachys rosea]